MTYKVDHVASCHVEWCCLLVITLVYLLLITSYARWFHLLLRTSYTRWFHLLLRTSMLGGVIFCWERRVLCGFIFCWERRMLGGVIICWVRRMLGGVIFCWERIKWQIYQLVELLSLTIRPFTIIILLQYLTLCQHVHVLNFRTCQKFQDAIYRWFVYICIAVRYSIIKEGVGAQLTDSIVYHQIRLSYP